MLPSDRHAQLRERISEYTAQQRDESSVLPVASFAGVTWPHHMGANALVAHTPNEKVAPVRHSHGGVCACDLLNRVQSDGKPQLCTWPVHLHMRIENTCGKKIPRTNIHKPNCFNASTATMTQVPLGCILHAPPLSLAFSLTFLVCDGGRSVVWDWGGGRCAPRSHAGIWCKIRTHRKNQ